MGRFIGAGKAPIKTNESSLYKAAVPPVPPVVELWSDSAELVKAPIKTNESSHRVGGAY